MIEAIGSSVRSVHLCWTTWHHIPEYSNLHVQIFSLLRHFSYPHYASASKYGYFFFFSGPFMWWSPFTKTGPRICQHFKPPSYLHSISSLKREAAGSSLMFVPVHIAWIPCDCNHNIHCHENIWSHTQGLLLVWWYERGFMIRKWF